MAVVGAGQLPGEADGCRAGSHLNPTGPTHLFLIPKCGEHAKWPNRRPCPNQTEPHLVVQHLQHLIQLFERLQVQALNLRLGWWLMVAS